VLDTSLAVSVLMRTEPILEARRWYCAISQSGVTSSRPGWHGKVAVCIGRLYSGG
jgi:hypothetical protein